MFKIMPTMVLVKKEEEDVNLLMTVHDNGEDNDECDENQNKTTLTMTTL